MHLFPPWIYLRFWLFRVAVGAGERHEHTDRRFVETIHYSAREELRCETVVNKNKSSVNKAAGKKKATPDDDDDLTQTQSPSTKHRDSSRENG